MYHFTSIKSAALAILIKTIRSKKTKQTVKHTHVRNDQRNSVKKELSKSRVVHTWISIQMAMKVPAETLNIKHEFVSH